MESSLLRHLATLETVLVEMKGFAFTQFFYMLALTAAVNRTGDFCIKFF